MVNGIAKIGPPTFSRKQWEKNCWIAGLLIGFLSARVKSSRFQVGKLPSSTLGRGTVKTDIYPGRIHGLRLFYHWHILDFSG